MAITSVPTLGPDPFTVNASVLNGKVDPLVTDYNGNIDNTNIAAAAAISNSKLNLAAITQAVALSGGLTLSTTAQTMTLVPLNEAKGADIASAAAPNITSATGNFVHITGTVTITSFATATSGIRRVLVFDGILTFTHNATSLILPTGANITTAAGDSCVMLSEGSGNWRCVSYQRKDGTALVSTTVATQTNMEAATDNVVMVTPLAVNWHPGVAKAWCNFNGTGTPAMTVRYNMDASITDNATGDWTVSITTDFSSGNYCMVASSLLYADTNSYSVGIKFGTSPAAGSINVRGVNGAGTYADSSIINLAFYGDQ